MVALTFYVGAFLFGQILKNHLQIICDNKSIEKSFDNKLAWTEFKISILQLEL